MVYSYTQISQYLRCPRSYRYRYLDGWQEIEERNGSDALTQQYVYGTYTDEPVVLDRNLDGDNSATGPNEWPLR